MSVRADISKGYRVRYGIIAAVLLGFMVWSFYDGFVKYPKNKEIYDQYIKIRETQGNSWATAWQQWATENGVSTSEPSEVSQNDINTQKGMGIVTGILGFAAAFYFFAIGARFVSADKESGLSTNKVKNIPWNAFKSVDVSRWQTKGIAVAHFDHENATGRITLDDWKFDRDATTDIFNMLKDNTDLIEEVPTDNNDEEMDEIA